MKALVVYFSRNGQSSRLAREIAKRCHADLDVIRELHEHDGWRARWRSGWHALVRAAPPIRHPTRNPARYDLVIIGAPVWKLGLAPPVRSYVQQFGAQFKQVAFFCAEGGSSDERVFTALGRACGKWPIATFAVDRKHLPPAAHIEGMSDFLHGMHLQ